MAKKKDAQDNTVYVKLSENMIAPQDYYLAIKIAKEHNQPCDVIFYYLEESDKYFDPRSQKITHATEYRKGKIDLSAQERLIFKDSYKSNITIQGNLFSLTTPQGKKTLQVHYMKHPLTLPLLVTYLLVFLKLLKRNWRLKES